MFAPGNCWIVLTSGWRTKIRMRTPSSRAGVVPGPGASVLACELFSHPPRPDTDGSRLGERSAQGLRPMMENSAQKTLRRG